VAFESPNAPNRIKLWPIVKLRPQEQDLVTFACEKCGCRVEYVGLVAKTGESQGPINGETTDDSLVDHIFLWCSQGLRDSHVKLNTTLLFWLSHMNHSFHW
jgi:hypothetical protein